jgi:hypothetical protein
MPQLTFLAQMDAIFAKFIDIFQLPERPVLLGSEHDKSPLKKREHD